MSVSTPHTDAHETKPSRNFATIFGSPLAVSRLLGSLVFGDGRLVRRRSARPPPDVRAGGGPNRDSSRARGRPPPGPPVMATLGRRGRYAGAVRDSSARRRASAVGQRAS